MGYHHQGVWGGNKARSRDTGLHLEDMMIAQNIIFHVKSWENIFICNCDSFYLPLEKYKEDGDSSYNYLFKLFWL
jgi:hypothetical protein